MLILLIYAYTQATNSQHAYNLLCSLKQSSAYTDSIAFVCLSVSTITQKCVNRFRSNLASEKTKLSSSRSQTIGHFTSR